MSSLNKLLVSMATILIVGLVVVGLIRATMFTFVDNYEIGYTYNYWSGQVGRIKHNGYVWSPFYQMAVHTMDARPMQVCISTIQRVLNCKLVQFDPEGIDPNTGKKGLELFIGWHGRGNYEGPGNAAQGSTPTTFASLLMNYAYDNSGQTYAFLRVIKELRSDTIAQPVGVTKTPGGQQ